MNNNNTTHDALAKAKGIASAARMGQISYDQAKKLAQPYLDEVNAKGREISKKYGKRYQPLMFSKLAR